MASTITTTDGTAAPTRFNSQQQMDICHNGVRWACIVNDDDARLEFWHSEDGGANWAEDTSQRISGVTRAAGIDIGRRGDNEERLVVAWVDGSDGRVRANFGRFRANRQSFTWQGSFMGVSRPGKSGRHPVAKVFHTGSSWNAAFAWSHREGGKTSLWWTRALYRDSGGAHTLRTATQLHTRVSSVETWPTIAYRHLGDEHLPAASPDLYIAWAQGASGDTEPRQYLMRMTARGTVWDATHPRVMRESGVSSGGQTAACFTGQTFACARTPLDGGDGEDETLQLHLMDPGDTTREVIDVPELGKGRVINVGISWNSGNGDIYIVACGATDQTPAVIRFRWATRAFGAWDEVGAAGLVTDSLSLRPGSQGNAIEGIYSVVNGTDRDAEFETFETVNRLPQQATWTVGGGTADVAAGLTVGPWSHNDLDGDSQAQYTLERRVNGGSANYWNGVSWQSTLVNISSAADHVDLSSGWASDGDTVVFRVRTADDEGFGDWSPGLTYLGAAAVTVTITSPADEGSVTETPLIVQWDAAEQAAYLVELETADGSGTLYSSGKVSSAGLRTHEVVYDLEDGVGYDVEVTVWSDEGLASATVKHDFTASLVPPPVPLFATAAVPAEGAIDVTIDNDVPGGGEAAATENDLYHIETDLTETLIATGIDNDGTYRDHQVAHDTEVTYLIVARTATGAVRRSDA